MKKGSPAIMALATEVSDVSGVQLGEKQKDMVVQRLHRRMALLGLASEEEYVKYYLENRKSEFRELISLFTTHHSYFFREFKHFEMLKEKILPQIIPQIRKREDKTLHIWSAACSRGQEVYSLAIFVEQALKELAPDLSFRVCGSDIDAITVEFAKNAVFTKKEVDSIPQVYQTDNFVRGHGEYSDYVKIHPRIHQKCWFQYSNLLDQNTWPKQNFDIIFCRNVFIYFSPKDMEKTALAFQKKLSLEGSLFLGLTETLNGLKVDFESIGPSVYGAQKAKSKAPLTLVPNTATKLVEAKPEMKIKRVLCVDDSPTILSLLRQIFVKEQGFQVVDTAANGLEARSKVIKNQYDLITLDIHMPVMNGLEFLRNSPGLKLPPVMVISSVDRQDKTLALEMLKLGAHDYIEKPSLKEFNERREEILLKAKLAVEKKTGSFKTSVDKLFDTEAKMPVVTGKVATLFHYMDQKRVDAFAKSAAGTKVEHLQLAIDKLAWTIPRCAACDVLVILSNLNEQDLALLERSGKRVFLLEDAYAMSKKPLHSKFEIFPMASLGYEVNKFLRAARDKN